MTYNDARALRMIMHGEADEWLHRYALTCATIGNGEFACHILDEKGRTLCIVRSVQEWRQDKESIRANLTEMSLQAA